MVSHEKKLLSIVEVLNSNKFKLEDIRSKMLFQHIFNLLGDINSKIFNFLYDDIIVKTFAGDVPNFSYNIDKERVELDYDNKKIYLFFQFDIKSILVYASVDRPVNDKLFNDEQDIDSKNLLMNTDLSYYYYSYDYPNKIEIERNDYYMCNIDYDQKGIIKEKEETFYLSQVMLNEIYRLQAIADYLYMKIQMIGESVAKELENDINTDECVYQDATEVSELIEKYQEYEEKIQYLNSLYNKEERVIISTTINEKNNSDFFRTSICVNEKAIVREK